MTHRTTTVDFSPSCWHTRFWLHSCEGFQVWAGDRRVGYVEAVLERGGQVHSLLVRVGERFHHRVAVPAGLILGIDPLAERLDVAPDSWRAGDQLTLPLRP